jgi:amidophosphoribosyltransferase
MGGFFGVASKEDCVLEVFYGVDYHSHLGTRRGGMATYGDRGFDRAIHNIENTPFRTKFDKDSAEMKGYLGIGCISDYEPQPLLIQSHLGSFAIVTVGKINNEKELLKTIFDKGHSHFQEMTTGKINATELVASLICSKNSVVEGMSYVQDVVDGSMSMLLMTPDGLYAARDKFGRTPVVIGEKDGAHCVSFESHAYINLGYADHSELGPGEIVFLNADKVETLKAPGKEMKICSFLWVYYGYPTSSYEGINVEEMRYECGKLLAKRDGNLDLDIVAGVPDSGLAHAIGYSNASSIPFARPFIKYTPTWPRSFMPSNQAQRSLIAKMKLIPVHKLIKDKKMLLIDDSIVRGTQLRGTTEFLYESGAKEVHMRPACPPLLFGCKYLNFSRSKSEMDLITRRTICELEGKEDVPMEVLLEYTDPDSPKYLAMEKAICDKLGFTTLKYTRLDDLIEAIGLEPCKLCTYCWSGRE